MQVKIDGLDISYIDEGNEQGGTILFLHGWGCSGEVYRSIIDHLSPHFRIVLPDLPGFGASDEPETAWGVAQYAGFVRKFAVALGLSNVILMAHSLGCRIIIKLFSGELPFLVEKIVITGGAGIKPVQTAAAKRRTKLYKIGKNVLSFPPVKALFPDALEKYRRSHGSADYNSATPIMRECLVKIVNEDLRENLHNVTPSTLLIWGENDDATPLEDGRLMEQKMPDAGLAVIKNAGHYAFLEQSGVFMSILSSFFSI